MDTKYGIHYTSNEIVREAKQYLLNTTRPETPAQCSRSHLAQGDTMPRKNIVQGGYFVYFNLKYLRHLKG